MAAGLDELGSLPPGSIDLLDHSDADAADALSAGLLSSNEGDNVSEGDAVSSLSVSSPSADMLLMEDPAMLPGPAGADILDEEAQVGDWGFGGSARVEEHVSAMQEDLLENWSGVGGGFSPPRRGRSRSRSTRSRRPVPADSKTKQKCSAEI